MPEFWLRKLYKCPYNDTCGLRKLDTADRVFLVREGDEFSTLSRAEEVALVSDIGIAALGSMLCGPIEGASMDLPPYVLDATPAADASALEDWMTWLNS